MAVDVKAKKKPVAGTTTPSLGAQMNKLSNVENPQAPRSLGDLMSPSTFGRGTPASNDEEFEAKKERNKSFLSSPETKAQLMQFGLAMLASAGSGNPIGNIGKAAALAFTLPARARVAGKEDATKEEAEALALEEKRLDIAKKKKDLLGGEEKDSSELLKLLNEADTAEMAGDYSKAAILRSRAYQLSQQFSLTTGEILKFPGLGGKTTGNVGIVDTLPTVEQPADSLGRKPAKTVSGTNIQTTQTTASNPLETMIADGPTIEAIPGGKVDLARQEAEQKVAIKKLDEIQRGANIGYAVQDIVNLLDTSVAPNVTVAGLGALLKYVPLTSARTVSGALDVLKSNAGFTQLQALRDASETGGALGPVSDTENKLLQSTWVNLDQGQTAEGLRRNLLAIKFLFDPIMLEERNKLSQALKNKEITADEAMNAFNAMYRDAIFGPSVPEAVEGDLAEPPEGLEERFKELWPYATLEQKKALIKDLEPVRP